MSVDVRGLKITIGGKPIVSDADMTIADGERVGLIGSSAVCYTHLRAHETSASLVGSEMCIRDRA